MRDLVLCSAMGTQAPSRSAESAATWTPRKSRALPLYSEWKPNSYSSAPALFPYSLLSLHWATIMIPKQSRHLACSCLGTLALVLLPAPKDALLPESHRVSPLLPPGLGERSPG